MHLQTQARALMMQKMQLVELNHQQLSWVNLKEAINRKMLHLVQELMKLVLEDLVLNTQLVRNVQIMRKIKILALVLTLPTSLQRRLVQEQPNSTSHQETARN